VLSSVKQIWLAATSMSDQRNPANSEIRNPVHARAVITDASHESFGFFPHTSSIALTSSVRQQ
jgi:hypothetical protein